MVLLRRKAILAAGSMGLLFAPFAASAVTNPTNVTNNNTVTASITATISISPTTSTTTLALSPTSSAVESAASTAMTITTNNSAGYLYTIQDDNATNSLTQTTPSATLSPQTSSTTFALPAQLITNAWGYHFDSMGGTPGTGQAESSVAPFANSIKFADVPVNGSPDTIANVATPNSPGGTAYTAWFGANADNTKPSGTGYTDIVVFTATGN